METYDLFSSRVYKTKIDPSSYEKQSIVETLLKNYNKNPVRNRWDDISETHHTLKDWDNKDYEKVDTSSLEPVYDNIVKEFINSVKWNCPITYNWFYANFAVNTKFMREHDHFSIDENGHCLFSCIHYIKFDKNNHSTTQFVNPLPFVMFPLLTNNISKSVSSKEIENSTYFNSWELNTNEEDFVIFPSWLKHTVLPNKKNSDTPRIVSVVNISVKFQNT